MSQLLVGVINNTSENIYIWNSESSDNAKTIKPDQVMVIQGKAGHWNIPDCSSAEYFPEHHMEIRKTQDGPPMFSFWDDDKAKYVIQTCPGDQYDQQTTMPGASDLGNGANIVIQVQQSGLSALAAIVAGS